MKRLFLFVAIICGTLLCSAQEDKAKKALIDYINNGDTSFSWQLRDSLAGKDVTVYRLRMQSQTWRNKEWIHELVIMVPSKLSNQEVLLHISGGKADEKSGEPLYHEWDNNLIGFMSGIASRSKAITAILWQVPRQPLYNGMTEDELVSYTLHNFQKDKDYSWPLLFPMTKSAIRAMDAIEEFSLKQGIRIKPNRFITNGISKRGWTTWLTAACNDKRIVAIAPMVIDILNMPISVPYQRHMYGSYSIHIQDYVNLGLTEEAATESGRELVTMIDPYSYRKQYTMPKMLFFGTNDEFWTVDAVKNYIDGIPGRKYISYVTNAGHSLGDKKAAFSSLEAFFRQTIEGEKYPRFDYTLTEGSDHATITLKLDKRHLEDIEIWEATSENREFRQSRFTPIKKGISHKRKAEIRIDYPKSGYKAFIVMVKYRHPNGDGTYNISTRMYTADSNEVFDEVFESHN